MQIPRVALTAINSSMPVTSPLTSLLVYNTTAVGAGVNAVTPGYYYWSGSSWMKLATANAWTTQGNSGTDAATNFIGTTDDADLVFKVNGKKAGLLEDTADIHTGNISWGIGALKNTGGSRNIGIGTNAGQAGTTGSNNILLGSYSNVDIGHSNATAIGYRSYVSQIIPSCLGA